MRYEDVCNSPERDHNDCTVIASSIVGDINYSVARRLMHRFGRRNGCGMCTFDMLYALHRAGLKLEAVGSWFPVTRIDSYWTVALYRAGLTAKYRKRKTEFRSPCLYKDIKTRARYSAKTIGRVYPKGKYLVFFYGHVAAMVDGIIEDYTEGRRHIVKSIYKVTGDVDPLWRVKYDSTQPKEV